MPLHLSWLEFNPVSNEESAQPILREPRVPGWDSKAWLQVPALYFFQLSDTGQTIPLFHSPSANQTPMASWPLPDACAGEGTTQA